MQRPPEYPIGDLARIFPEMPPEDHARLVDSIRDRGLLEPITVWRGEVIDGRHRLDACAEAGVEPRFRHASTDAADPVQYVLDKNATRRHLDESQRAVVAHRLSARSTPGRPRAADGNCANLRSFSQGAAAKALGVSRRLVTHAARVLADESPAVAELRHAVERGQVKVSDARHVLDQPPEVQQRSVELFLQGQARTLAGALREVLEENALREDADQLEVNRSMHLGDTITLHVAPVSGLQALVAPASVDAMIAHPPYSEEALPRFSDLAAFAAHALKPTGVMVVVGSGMLLPWILEQLYHPDLQWIGEFDLLFRGPPMGSGRPYRVKLHRRPLLIYGKGDLRFNGGEDLLEVPDPADLPRGWDRNDAAMELIVERFTRPGQVVCDPIMLDRGGTALAARKLGCNFIGAERIESCVRRIRNRLEEAEAAGLRG